MNSPIDYRSPLPSPYSYELRSLIKQIFRKDPRQRPSVNTILKRRGLLKMVNLCASAQLDDTSDLQSEEPAAMIQPRPERQEASSDAIESSSPVSTRKQWEKGATESVLGVLEKASILTSSIGANRSEGGHVVKYDPSEKRKEWNKEEPETLLNILNNLDLWSAFKTYTIYRSKAPEDCLKGPLFNNSQAPDATDSREEQIEIDPERLAPRSDDEDTDFEEDEVDPDWILELQKTRLVFVFLTLKDLSRNKTEIIHRQRKRQRHLTTASGRASGYAHTADPRHMIGGRRCIRMYYTAFYGRTKSQHAAFVTVLRKKYANESLWKREKYGLHTDKQCDLREIRSAVREKSRPLLKAHGNLSSTSPPCKSGKHSQCWKLTPGDVTDIGISDKCCRRIQFFSHRLALVPDDIAFRPVFRGIRQICRFRFLEKTSIATFFVSGEKAGSTGPGASGCLLEWKPMGAGRCRIRKMTDSGA
ncbi:unnamed protein product [Ranitomeya imitator]|uniref:Uncharacterized protein n=1 Tax=Ranitomeya imitator TaxID=111125 RepID=A0ABN9KQW4_9NEOB|nr:unnamed protein product [Ranitomeya imitator]